MSVQQFVENFSKKISHTKMSNQERVDFAKQLPVNEAQLAQLIRSIDHIKKYPDVVSVLLTRAHQELTAEKFGYAVSGAIAELATFPKETARIFIKEGVTHSKLAHQGFGWGSSSYFTSDGEWKSKRVNYNIGTSLEGFIVQRGRTAETLEITNLLLNTLNHAWLSNSAANSIINLFQNNTYQQLLDGRSTAQKEDSQNILVHTLKGIAPHHPSILAKQLDYFHHVLGDEQTATLLSTSLTNANKTINTLSKRQKDGKKLTEKELEAFINLRNTQTYLLSHALNETVGSKTQNAIQTHLNLTLLADQPAVHLQKLTQQTAIAYEKGLPIAQYYANFLLGDNPKTLLSQSDLQETLLGLALEKSKLNYSAETLRNVTGQRLSDLPFFALHKSAGPDTLAPDVFRNPTRIFQDTMPGFGLPVQQSGQGYVLNVEFEQPDRLWNVHLMATTNVLDRTLAATGNSGIQTIALISAPEEDFSSLLGTKDGKKLFNNALVIQSSTGSRADRKHILRSDNHKLIAVFPSGNSDNHKSSQRDSQDPNSSRHLTFAHTVEFGVLLHDPKKKLSHMPLYSYADGQSLVTIPMFSADYPFHAQFPNTRSKTLRKGHYSTGTSFASPIGAALIAEARTRFPHLPSHHIIYALAQHAEPVTLLEKYENYKSFGRGFSYTRNKYGDSMSYTATPHGLEFNPRAGAGEVCREQFFDMLNKMSEAVQQNPLLAPEITRENQVMFDNLPQDQSGQFDLNITPSQIKNPITTRPVFSFVFDRVALQNMYKLKYKLKDLQYPIRITAPNGTQFEYLLNLKAVTDGGGSNRIYVSGVGFLGAETHGNWKIEMLDPSKQLPIKAINMEMFTTTKQDLINLPEFRKLHTLNNMQGKDLSHLREIYIQPDKKVGFKGGWLSKATEEGWINKVNLKGTLLSEELTATLPKKFRQHGWGYGGDAITMTTKTGDTVLVELPVQKKEADKAYVKDMPAILQQLPTITKPNEQPRVVLPKYR